MTANGRRRWRKWAKRNGVGRGALATYRVFRRHQNTTFADMEGMRPGRIPIKPFTARSLVGMSSGARKRAIMKACGYPQRLKGRRRIAREVQAVNGKGFYDTRLVRWHRPKDQESLTQDEQRYRIGQRLRPCPGKHGCVQCTNTCGACEDLCPDDTRCQRCGSMMTTEGPYCDGSGVLPAKGTRA